MSDLGDLFRRSAVERQRVRLSGEVTLPHPPGFRLASATVLIAVLVGVGFASTATYARRETVSGWITPDAGLIRLKARRAGVVEAVDVAEGDEVQAGQQIAIIRVPNDVHGGDATDQLAESLQRQTAYRAQSVEATVDVLEQEFRQLRSQRLNLAQEALEARSRADLQQERILLARAEFSRVESLAEKGYFPRAEIDIRRAALLSSEQEHSSLRSALLSVQRQMAELEARLATLPGQIAVSRADAGQDAESLGQQRTQLRSQQTYVIRAETAGRVSALPVRIGQAIADAATIAVITPSGSSLQAELFVPSRGVGFVRAGQDVRLMVDAFPFQKFGANEGRIAHVSTTVVAPGEIDIPGLELREPVFRARVTLDQSWIDAYGARVPLQAGMLSRADIIVERRTLIEWLLDPLYAVGRR